MSIICPTILASDTETYKEQVARLQPFATRVQIDLADGDFAPTQTIGPSEVRWPTNWEVDIHLMYRRPVEQLEVFPGAFVYRPEECGPGLESAELVEEVQRRRDEDDDDERTCLPEDDKAAIDRAATGWTGGSCGSGIGY